MTSRSDSRAARVLAVTLGLLADTSAGLVVLTVVPLVLLQLPNLIAAAVPSMIAGLHPGGAGTSPVGTGSAAELMRVSGLALPAMVLVSPPAAVAARRGGAWPVLLGGLALLGLADVAGNLVGVRLGSTAGMVHVITGGATGGVTSSVTSSATALVAGVGVDRAAHGAGAGLAAAGALALLWERGGTARRVLACLWAAAAACTLVTAVPLLWPRLSDGGWRALLQPYPQLTGAALAVTVLYVVLARGASLWKARSGLRAGQGANGGGRGELGNASQGERVRGRGERAPAERAQLAMLSVPVAGVAGLTIAASFGWAPRAQLAAGALGAVVLAALAVALSRDAVTGGGLCFPLVGLAAGLVAAPSAGAVAGLRPPVAAGHPAAAHGLLGQVLAAIPGGTASLPAAVAAAAALACGAAGWLAVLAGRRVAAVPALAVMAGLAAAGAGLLLLQLGPEAGHQASAPPSARTLAMVFSLLAGGIALALGPALADAPPGGALTGLPLMLAGALAGYLIAGSIRIGLLPDGRREATVPAVLDSLGGAARAWELAAAGLALAAVLGVFLAGRARRATMRAHRAG